MNIKSLRCMAIALLLLAGIPMITGCSNHQKQTQPETIQYTKVEVGNVPFQLIDEYGSENKYIRQWIINNKENKGFYTKIFKGNTYLLYSMGKQDYYGYGISSVSLVKEEEHKPIILYLKTTNPDLSIARRETNYPYVALKIEGNIKDEFKEKVLAESESLKEKKSNRVKDDSNENK